MKLMNQTKERILFLYLKAGGGHVSAARALAAEFNRRYSHEEVETHLLDCIPQKANLWRKFIEGGYRFFITNAPLLWEIFWKLSTIPLIMRNNSPTMLLITSAQIRRYIRKHRITRIVNLHPFMHISLFRALKQLNRLDMPAVTIVTDPFTCHPFWFFRQFTHLIVFSERIMKHAQKCLSWIPVSSAPPPEKREARIFPPLINSRYNERLDSSACSALKHGYGFDPGKPLMLIIGGGEGLPGGERCLQAILAADEPELQIAFICGRNRSQYRRVRKIAKHHPRATIQVYGFVNFVYELMNAANFILAKAGPATIFEALMLHKPLILTSRIYGQEDGNVDFVVNGNYGWHIPHPRNITMKIREIMRQPEIIDRIVSNIKNGNVSNGTSLIADYIIALPPSPSSSSASDAG